MAVRQFDAAPVPRSLPGTLADRAYTVQNQSSDARVYVTQRDSPPRDNDPAFVIPPGQGGQIKAEIGNLIYLWAEAGQTALVVYDTVD